jgi:hypothetical protein
MQILPIIFTALLTMGMLFDRSRFKIGPIPPDQIMDLHCLIVPLNIIPRAYAANSSSLGYYFYSIQPIILATNPASITAWT